jgi:hypothetical protein
MTKNEKASNEARKANPLPPCGDFQKMAEMIKSCCPTEDGILDCCSFASRMMGHAKKAQETEEKTQKA